jgi:hypothetical protein
MPIAFERGRAIRLDLMDEFEALGQLDTQFVFAPPGRIA